MPVTICIAEVLGLNADELDELLALAGRPPTGLSEKLAKSPEARAFFRFAIDRLTGENWQELLVQVQRKHVTN
jgi:hypothetical protein